MFAGFGGWHMGNQNQDEVFLAAQEAVGAHRDSQGRIYDPLYVTSFALCKKCEFWRIFRCKFIVN